MIVTTRNVERTLDPCLVSIRMQDHEPLELIVVDNSSDDATPQIARARADVFLVAGPERSTQRNLGVETARGDWMLWIDADMILAPDVVSSALRAAEVSGEGGTGEPSGVT